MKNRKIALALIFTLILTGCTSKKKNPVKPCSSLSFFTCGERVPVNGDYKL